MNDLLIESDRILRHAGFRISHDRVRQRDLLAFEDATVIGFIFFYESVHELLTSWMGDSDSVIRMRQFELRRAREKAWNVYVVALTGEEPSGSDRTALAAIEEDLTATRKIARAGVADAATLREALLPLLPLLAAPLLEAVDLPAEISARATELPQPAVSTFLSQADDAFVLQILEEAS